MTALFESIIFGPVRSRRLGLSLGVNLLPQHAKICSFDCIYCECGSNSERKGERVGERKFAEKRMVLESLQEVLTSTEDPLDVITFAGNGEPTLHPDFAEIIDSTIELRNKFAPTAKISVLSNSTNLGKPSVVEALKRVDNNILKLDSAIDSTVKLMDRPNGRYSVSEVIDQMSAFEGQCIVQTMFLRGEVEGETIDNTQQHEVERWIEAIKRIAPRSVMIYTIDRDTPCRTLEKVSHEEMERIAEKVRELGIACSVA